MPTTPTPITALPAAPDRGDRATFSSRAVAMFAALKDVFVGQVNAIATVTNTNATEAATSATSAATSEYNAGVHAANAAAASGAPMWVSGTTYTLGAPAWSPANRLVYRRIVAGAGSTDPSTDPANWAVMGVIGLPIVAVSGTTATAAPNAHYEMQNASASTLTLPASPISGDTVAVTFTNSLLSNVIARNGNTVMDIAEDMTIDAAQKTIPLRYITNTWRLV